MTSKLLVVPLGVGVFVSHQTPGDGGYRPPTA
jgi:hypothetical protein